MTCPCGRSVLSEMQGFPLEPVSAVAPSGARQITRPRATCREEPRPGGQTFGLVRCGGGWLVQGGVERHAGDELVLAALAAEDRAPEVVGILREDVVEVGGLDDPVVPFELILELFRPPAGDSREHAGA